MFSPRACGCAALAQAIQALTVLPPGTFRVIQNSWVSKTKPKQLARSPANSLKAVNTKELSQLGYSKEVGGQLPSKNPESLLSTKYSLLSTKYTKASHLWPKPKKHS